MSYPIAALVLARAFAGIADALAALEPPAEREDPPPVEPHGAPETAPDLTEQA